MSDEFAHKCLEALLYEVALFCLHLQHLKETHHRPLDFHGIEESVRQGLGLGGMS